MSSREPNALPPEENEPGTEPVAQPIVTGVTAPAALPQDLRVPWGWGDLLLFLLVTVGGTAVVSYLLLLVFYLSGVSATEIRNSASEKSLFVVVNQGILSSLLLLYLYAHVRARFGRPFWQSLGWRPLESAGILRRLAYGACIAGGIVFALFIQFASAALEKKTKLPIEAFFQDRRSAVLLMVMGVAIAPLVEETIFRGYIYPVLARSFGIGWGVLVTGTLFGLLHAPQLWGGWGHIFLLILVGIVFTYVRALSRTVVTSYLLHLSYNSFLFAVFLFSTAGLRHLPVN